MAQSFNQQFKLLGATPKRMKSWIEIKPFDLDGQIVKWIRKWTTSMQLEQFTILRIAEDEIRQEPEKAW